jgi:2-oxoisovalerate dehydrogenase E1 component
VHWALELLDELEPKTLDILDLRTLKPLDYEAILDSVKRTGKVVVLQEDSAYAGVAAEVSSWIGEHAFEHLDAPVKRVSSLDTPIPFAGNLEEKYLAKHQLRNVIEELLRY